MDLIENFGLYRELFGLSFLASLVVGIVLPLVGALMFLRKEAFLGIAVPQFAAAGLALGLLFLPWFPAMSAYFLDHGHPPMGYLLPFAAGAAVLALFLFSLMRRRGGHSGALLAASFATASALGILFLNASPAGANMADTVMRGEVLLLDVHGLEVLAGVCLIGLLFLIFCRRTLLVTAFDRDQAVALGRRVAIVETYQFLLLGIMIGAGVMTVGPILVFGLLFLPPLASRATATTLAGFLRGVLWAGLVSVLLAWPLSLQLDWPYGPAAVCVAAVYAILASCWGRFRRVTIN